MPDAVAGGASGYSNRKPIPCELPSLETLVDLGRLFDREHRRHERVEVQAAAGDQIEEAREVAPLRPAHVADWVVDAVELVPVVVATGPVRTREADVELLLVVGVPREIEPALPDVDDSGTVARESRRDVDRFVGRPAGGEEHVVDPGAVRRLGDLLCDELEAGGARVRAGQRARLLRLSAPVLDDVDAERPEPPTPPATARAAGRPVRGR